MKDVWWARGLAIRRDESRQAKRRPAFARAAAWQPRLSASDSPYLAQGSGRYGGAGHASERCHP